MSGRPAAAAATGAGRRLPGGARAGSAPRAARPDHFALIFPSGTLKSRADAAVGATQRPPPRQIAKSQPNAFPKRTSR